MRPIFPPSRWMAAALLVAVWPAWPETAKTQEEVIPILRGEVKAGDEPLTRGMVVLHLVSADSSGEVDSVRVASDGTFQIRLPHVPNHAVRQEVFFASVQYQGLHYFGPAITEPVQLDSLYVIQAYDTVSVPPGGATLPLSSRNLFLEKASEGWEATDVFQIVNNGDRTLYSPHEGLIWSYPLPSSAADFQVGQADLAPDAVRFSQERLELYSPLPPGERFLLVRYHLGEEQPLIPMPGRTDRMEVFVRQPGPPAEFPPLVASTPVELDPGAVYRRYSGTNLLDTEIRSEVASEPWTFPAEGLGIILAGILLGAGLYAYRRHTASPEVAGEIPASLSHQDLVLAIARLDETFSGKQTVSDKAREEYQAQRARLLEELKQRT